MMPRMRRQLLAPLHGNRTSRSSRLCMARRRKQPSCEQAIQTCRAVDEALHLGDPALVRKVAAVRGLSNSSLRSRAWPVLLGIDSARLAEYQRETRPHRDVDVVTVDVERSLFFVADEEQRAAKRAVLRRVLNSVVQRHAPTGVHYWQGLHDIASVLLVTTGDEALSCAMLETLLLHHLRDCAASTLAPVLQLLDLVFPLLATCDQQLSTFLQDSGLMPHFALSWLLTWHAHNTSNVEAAARLFDLFLSSSPLMPLYVGTVAVLEQRSLLMDMPCNGPELHRFLSKLDVAACMNVDLLCAQALALHRRVPPSQLCSIAGVTLPPSSAVLAWPFAFTGCSVTTEPRVRSHRILLRPTLAAILVAVFAGGASRLLH